MHAGNLSPPAELFHRPQELMPSASASVRNANVSRHRSVSGSIDPSNMEQSGEYKMKTAMRLAALAMLTTSACEKTDAPPAGARFQQTLAALAEGAACERCDWATVVGRDIPVSYIGCMDDRGNAEHCHLQVSGDTAQRSVRVTKNGDRYNFFVTTKDDSETGMECLNLQQHSNRQLISGKCTIREPNLQGKAEHEFGAKLVDESTSTQETKLLIRFVFEHDEVTEQGGPIHNGEGHAHP
jgi:hypothetical protein